MDHLTKQQLILLALLVSFVTSLATGIFTVSLMEQAPQGAVSIINRVVEKTVDATKQGQASVVTTVQEEDALAKSVENISKSIVKIKNRSEGTVAGMGLVVSKSGVVLIDKSLVASPEGYDVILSNGTAIPVTLVQSQINGDIGFLAPALELTPAPQFIVAKIASSVKLGQKIFSLSGSGTSTSNLGQGIVTRTGNNESDNENDFAIITSIPQKDVLVGSIAFDQNGHAIGIKTRKLSWNDSTNFYPMSKIREIIPSL